MGNSYFHFKRFSISSQEAGLKLTTDACLLGVIARHADPVHCLDIGTGCGILALLLADRFPVAVIDAVEIDEDVMKGAIQNFELSSFKSRIHPIQMDFLEYECGKTYDLIVCNPPYFKDHLQKKAGAKNNAIHNNTLELESLLKKTGKCMNADSKFYMILPAFEAEQIKNHCLNLGFCIQDAIQIHSVPGKHFRTILGIGKKKQETIHQILDMKDENGSPSNAFRQLMQPFYLENTEKYRKDRRQL